MARGAPQVFPGLSQTPPHLSRSQGPKESDPRVIVGCPSVPPPITGSSSWPDAHCPHLHCICIHTPSHPTPPPAEQHKQGRLGVRMQMHCHQHLQALCLCCSALVTELCSLVEGWRRSSPFHKRGNQGRGGHPGQSPKPPILRQGSFHCTEKSVGP